MGERKHELTDQDIRELVSRDWPDTTQRNIDAAIAKLKSRQPIDPDAGLGAQPWTATGGGALGVYKEIRTARGYMLAQVITYGLEGDYCPAAVTRATLSVPKAIELAREAAKPCPVTRGYMQRLADLAALAAKVIAIADGTDGSAA